jgi:hypothetical protein
MEITSITIVYADGSIVTSFGPFAPVTAPALSSPEDVEIDVILSDGSMKKFVPAAQVHSPVATHIQQWACFLLFLERPKRSRSGWMERAVFFAQYKVLRMFLNDHLPIFAAAGDRTPVG